MTVMERISAAGAKLLQREQVKAKTFDDLVVQCDSAKPPSADAIADTLEALGRTADELANELRRRQQRKAWQEQLAREPIHTATVRSAEATITASNREHEATLAAAKRRHEEICRTAREQIQTAQAELIQCGNARVRLMESHPEEIARRLRPLQDEVRRLQAEMARVDDDRCSARQVGVLTAERHQEATQRLANLEQQIAAVNQQIAAIDAEGLSA